MKPGGKGIHENILIINRKISEGYLHIKSVSLYITYCGKRGTKNTNYTVEKSD